MLSPGRDASMAPLQNIYGRSHLSLNGRWSYSADPYGNGFYDYRRQAFDASKSGKGGFYDDRKLKDKGDWVEYDFGRAPTMKVPGDRTATRPSPCLQAVRLLVARAAETPRGGVQQRRRQSS